MTIRASNRAHVLDWKGRPDTVLIVDGHADTRELYELWLSQHGFRVELAATATDALAVAAAAPIDVVVTELMLPDGGPTFIRALRDAPATADAVVIVLTTQTAPSQRQAALAAGADAYLPKPCGVLRLAEVMATTSHADAGRLD